MIMLCAWCPGAFNRTKAAHDAGLEVTHGICPDCKARLDAPEACDHCGRTLDCAGWCSTQTCAGRYQEAR